jgi:hypothetical protein
VEESVKRALAATVATALGAMLCVTVLAGCGGAAQPAGIGGSGAAVGAGSTTAPGAGNPASGSGAGAPQSGSDATGVAQIDQNLSAIDSELSGLDTEFAKATQSPQDGDGN